jgi:hypothetical protein
VEQRRATKLQHIQETRQIIQVSKHLGHHHKNHKAAVLSGAELCLTFLTTLSNDNANLILSDIYPDKHDTFFIAGQIKASQKMRTSCKVLSVNFQSSPTRLEKQLRAINKHGSFVLISMQILDAANNQSTK